MRSIGLLLGILGGFLIFLALKGKAGRAFTALLYPDKLPKLVPKEFQAPVKTPDPYPSDPDTTMPYQSPGEMYEGVGT